MQPVLIWGERLSWGRGFLVHVRPFPGLAEEGLSSDPQTAARQINQAMEMLVRESPAQYLWSYDRYKQPRQPESPDTGAAPQR
ncbi:lipid A biosynthesis lauroyl acyltransferase [Hydrogenophaga sp. T4]|nr:lipid A biosynthesis lauroyl acyltransferase [Hydrogenophaga sp. T4]